MANRFFSNILDLLPFTRARAADVEANFTAVEGGFDALAAELQFYIKITDNVVQTPLPATLARKNKALIFGPDGVITLSVDDYNDQRAAVLASANSAATSASNAATSANNSAAAANSAAISANNASASEANALASKNAAATSATNAATSETNALASKNAAATSATNAATSEANALTSKNAAATSATNAGTSETNALASKNAAATSATNAATSETNAGTSLTSFKRQYLGAAATAPTTRFDNTALQDGDLYFDTTNSPQPSMKVRSAGAWINAGSTVNALNKSQQFTATAGQTTFAVTGGYDANFCEVFLNGVFQRRGVDVTLTSGTNVVFVQPLLVGDEVDVIAFSAFTVADTYNQATIDAKVQALTGRNRIINGDMRINQRSWPLDALGSAAPGGAYTVDRWQAMTNLVNTLQAGQFRTQNTLPGYSHFMRLQVQAAVAAPAAGDYFGFRQWIEGVNLQDFDFGQGTAKAVAISFMARSSVAGTFPVALRREGGTRTYPSTFTLPTANLWTRCTVIVPADPAAPAPVYGTNALYQVWFDFGSGSSFQTGTANAYNSTDLFVATGNTRLMATLNAFMDITGVQFEPGATATPFENREYGRELVLCQRYYERAFFRVDTALASAANLASTTVSYKATKRANPTVTRENETITNATFNSIQGSPESAAPIYNTTANAGSITGTLVASAEL